MSWIYIQTSGKMFAPDGELLAVGYSGHGEGRNNPAMQAVHDVGPIPVGWYDIGPPHDTTEHGPFVMALTPHEGNQMFGRSAFLCHGDNSTHDASKGCIIFSPRSLREKIWASGDRSLEVRPV